MNEMIRFCPRCRTERPLDEFFCGGIVNESPCNWDLSAEPIRPEGWRPVELNTSTLPLSRKTSRVCVNGHEVEDGDLFCLTCGADVAAETPDGADTQIIAGWSIVETMLCMSNAYERFQVINDEGLIAVLELYQTGFEPEPNVYKALESVSHRHVPKIYAYGRWEGRAYLILEMLTGRTLADLDAIDMDKETLHNVIVELGGALHALSEAGIRHRYLNPRVLLVRNDDPLDLVISGFGSARLSDFDLDIVAPLETNIYMAPEALVGVVSPASDWWSMGMILLEQLIGDCWTTRINPRAFLIQTLSGGIKLPESIDEQTHALLTGLLTRDHNKRWQWGEVSGWLRGDYPMPISPSLVVGEAQEDGVSIELGGVSHHTAAQFALHAGEKGLWEDASELLRSGAITTWLAERRSPSAEELRRLSARWESLPNDFRLMLALKVLNQDMPLVLRGDIITPGWLLANYVLGYELINSSVPQLLHEFGFEGHDWLQNLQGRAIRIRQQAEHSGILLNEEAFRIYQLNTSQTRLQAIWVERLRAFPEARHQRLAFMMECPKPLDSDLILLLSARLDYFRSANEVYEDVVHLSRGTGMKKPTFEEILPLLSLPRYELYRRLGTRLGQFAYCKIELLDRFARDFRLRKRLPLPQVALLASIAEDAWQIPSQQHYLADLLQYFEKKISLSAARGSLVRMGTGLNSSNVDIMDLQTPRLLAVELVEHIICRQNRPRRIDPMAFAESQETTRISGNGNRTIRPLLNRLTRLSLRDKQYRKETGLEGMYLGFPFLVRAARVKTQRPRVIPLLLWPVKLAIAARTAEQVDLAFDSGREEVRLNPALEQSVGPAGFEKWSQILSDLLQRSTLDIASVMEMMSPMTAASDNFLQRLAPQQREPAEDGDYLACSAVLFHSAFMGQAISADLRTLRNLPPAGAFGTMLGLSETDESDSAPEPDKENRYLVTDSDPSQETAIWKAMRSKGLLVEGPPGTGKSQTIVNMVTEAIGGGRSVLIVCQKRAALDVVHKRLVASGLEDRLALVGDIGKDRRWLIKTIREQLDNLPRIPAVNHAETTARRAGVAAAIKRCEKLLNSTHEALYMTDPQIGRSYRALLGELIELSEQEHIPAPQLREYMEGLSEGSTDELETQCVPHVHLWLTSRYESSPLASLRRFEPSHEALLVLSKLLQSFAASEEARAKDQCAPNRQLRLSGDENAYQIVRAWLNEDAPRFAVLSEEERTLLRNWQPLFKTTGSSYLSRGRQIVAELQSICQEIESDAPPQSDLFSKALSRLSDSLLEKLQKALTFCLHPIPFWRKCLPDYWLKRRKIENFLASHTVAYDYETLRELEQAIAWESRTRNRLRRTRFIQDELRIPAVDCCDSALLPSVVGRYLWTLQRLGTLVENLTSLPENVFLERAIMTTGADEWQRDLAVYTDSWRAWRLRLNSSQALSQLTPWLEEDFINRLHSRIDEDEEALSLLLPLMSRMEEIEPYQHFRALIPLLGTRVQSFFHLLRQSESNLLDIAPDKLEETVRNTIRRELRCAWKARLEQEHPQLLTDTQSMHKAVKELAEANLSMMALNREHLKTVDTGAIARKNNWEDVTRLTGARALSLREFFKKALQLGLLNIRPIWMMNPDTASRLLPLEASLFDLVIYDEASQLPVEYAVPTLFRAHTVVISGDEKQMPPTRFFSASLSLEEGDDYAAEEERALDDEEKRDFAEISDCTDILQLGRRALPRSMLEIHYRSRCGELIDFSNRAFYGGRLNVPNRRSPDELKLTKPLEFVEAGGLYENQTNRVEAEHVVEILRRLWSPHYEQRQSVGVVTFNQKQAELIEDVLEETIALDADFSMRYEEENGRRENGEDMSFFVKNVENVQGDERDVIVFSTTFGRDASGRFLRNFGILGQRFGERRLNVAITRARSKVVLVSSMPIHQISDMLTTQRMAMLPRDYLQMYLAYARAMSAGEFELARTHLSRVGGRTANSSSEIALRDAFQRIVAREVEGLGWKTEHTSASDGDVFAVDFLLKSPRSGRYFIGVECDTPRHPLLRGARARELWRPFIQSKVVPTIHRVSSRDWLINPEREKEKLHQAIAWAYKREEVG